MLEAFVYFLFFENRYLISCDSGRGIELHRPGRSRIHFKPTPEINYKEKSAVSCEVKLALQWANQS